MNIAILSGKGGTGKTTVATNLAAILEANYIDCDVEEPNGFIFLKPSEIRAEEVRVDYPVIDQEKCQLCGECITACQFNALFKTKKEILVFEKLCHACHACALACSGQAINFANRAIGVIEEGKANGLGAKRGVLHVGEPMTVPVIRSLLKNVSAGLNLLDCPPGTSCNVVNTLQHAQGAILVTEPSAFGIHDLKMAITLVQSFNLPYGVIINKWDGQGFPGEENLKEEFLREFLGEELLREKEIRILGYLPHNREAAEAYSRGEMLKDRPLYKEAFVKIAQRAKEVFAWT